MSLPVVAHAPASSLAVMKIRSLPAHPDFSDAQPLENSRTCNIVTFYEDFDSAIRAASTFDCLARSFGGNLPVSAASWSFSMLGNPRMKAAAIRNTADASVIVVAANGGRELPAHIAAWVENCISRDPDSKPVLVALHDDAVEGDGAAAPLCGSLSRIAGRKGAAFVCNSDLKQRLGHQFPPDPSRSESLASVRVLEKSPALAPSAHRWWGVNE